MIFRDKVGQPKDQVAMGFHLFHEDAVKKPHGRFILHMVDSDTGEVLAHWEQPQIITLDCGIQMARLAKDSTEPNHGINMLAVGTGATGALLSPDAPDEKQRKLNAELARKPFSDTTFRSASGVAVGYPTNVVDFTTSFGNGEAVGPLNEMGVMNTVSDNPLIKNINPNNYPTRDVTLDITSYDVLCNYLTFGVVTKPANAVLTLTWRLTF